MQTPNAIAADTTFWLASASSSTVQNFHSRFGLPDMLAKWPSLKTASIGPETTQALVGLNLAPTVEAGEHNIPGLVEAILKFEAGS